MRINFIIFFLCFTFFPFEVLAGKLSIYLIPSPYSYDFSSPRALTWSAIKNTYLYTPYKYRHVLGHANIELDCQKSTGEKIYYLTGMVSSNKGEDRNLIINKKVGLQVLFHPFPGELQSKEEVREDFDDRLGKEHISWISYLISESLCDRLSQYIQEYQDNKFDSVYGLPFRPRYGEGAGCSAFAVSFLGVAGVIEKEFHQKWTRRLRVPKGLIGDLSDDKKVPFYKVLLSKQANRWAREDEDYKEVFFWEPGSMHAWIRSAWNIEKQTPSGKYQLEQQGLSKGLLIDVRSKQTPKDSVWK